MSNGQSIVRKDNDISLLFEDGLAVRFPIQTIVTIDLSKINDARQTSMNPDRSLAHVDTYLRVQNEAKAVVIDASREPRSVYPERVPNPDLAFTARFTPPSQKFLVCLH